MERRLSLDRRAVPEKKGEAKEEVGRAGSISGGEEDEKRERGVCQAWILHPARSVQMY